MITRSLCSGACCLAIAQWGWCCDANPSEHAFAMAEYVPADVTTYVNVIDGAGLRRDLMRYPLGTWLTHWTVSPELAAAWSSLAASAKLSSGELFDEVFGEGFTLVVRGKGANAEWAMITQIDADRANRLLKSLSPRLTDLWQGVRICDLPEHQLLVARHGDTLLIGPRGKQRKLFESVCNAIVNELEQPLAEDDAFDEANELGGGSLFVFVRHDDGRSQRQAHHALHYASNQPGRSHANATRRTGNWTAVSGSLAGGELTLRHGSSQPIVKVGHIEHLATWDMAPLKALGENNVLALIKPEDQQAGILDYVVSENLGDENLVATLSEQDCGRRILVLDESSDAASSDKPATVIVARAVELGCDEAVTDVMLKLEGMNARISNLDRGAYLVHSGSLRNVWLASRSFQDFAQDEVSAIFRGLPVMEPRPLQWTVAEGHDAHWCVMSNDREKMVSMASALAAAKPEAPTIGAWLSCGSGDGRRLAEMLRKLAEGRPVMPELNGMTSHQALAQIAAVAGVVDQFRWSLARAAEDRLTLEVVVKLSETPALPRGR